MIEFLHKRYVRIDNNIKGQSNLICGKFAVGGNYNLTRDSYAKDN